MKTEHEVLEYLSQIDRIEHEQDEVPLYLLNDVKFMRKIIAKDDMVYGYWDLPEHIRNDKVCYINALNGSMSRWDEGPDNLRWDLDILLNMDRNIEELAYNNCWDNADESDFGNEILKEFARTGNDWNNVNIIRFIKAKDLHDSLQEKIPHKAVVASRKVKI